MFINNIIPICINTRKLQRIKNNKNFQFLFFLIFTIILFAIVIVIAFKPIQDGWGHLRPPQL
jgi:hypothetical protein